MKTPVIILIILWSTGLLIEAHMHGKPKDEEYNIFYRVAAMAIYISLFYWAGLFD
jgi:hypothetical protein